MSTLMSDEALRKHAEDEGWILADEVVALIKQQQQAAVDAINELIVPLDDSEVATVRRITALIDERTRNENGGKV